jgi:hypothetical protein
MAQRQKNEKLVFVKTGLTIALPGVLALKEWKNQCREQRGRGR